MTDSAGGAPAAGVPPYDAISIITAFRQPNGSPGVFFLIRHGKPLHGGGFLIYDEAQAGRETAPDQQSLGWDGWY
jgi:hypothetical protein